VTLASDLKKLAKAGVYPTKGRVERRWGQLLRESPRVRALLHEARDRGALIPLADVAVVSSGVVTRANAYFVVRELPFEQLPDRFHITKRDYKRVAVVEDGLKAMHRIERICLRPIVKGPEALIGPTMTAPSDQRLFVIREVSRAQLDGTPRFVGSCAHHCEVELFKH